MASHTAHKHKVTQVLLAGLEAAMVRRGTNEGTEATGEQRSLQGGVRRAEISRDHTQPPAETAGLRAFEIGHSQCPWLTQRDPRHG